MSDTEFERPARGSRWSDAQSREALQPIVESFAQATGFEVVGVSAVRDDGYLHILALAGPEEARAALLGSLAPVAPLMEALERAESWGRLQFVPHQRHDLDLDRWGWVSTTERPTSSDAWHAENLLVAPLYGADGELVAVLGVDEPRSGRVPGPEEREALESLTEHAGRSVVAILERERLAEQIRLAGAAADIVRRASASMAAHEVLAACGGAIVDGFRAQALWSQLRGEQPQAVLDPRPTIPPREVLALMERYAEAAWANQDVGIFAPERTPPPPLTQADADAVLDFMAAAGGESLLLVPLGAGQEWLGWLALSRGPGAAEWSQGEAVAALDIGRDLGQALASARTFEREHELVRELQGLSDYKSQLVATVSHELRTPLTSIAGFLEMLDDDPGLSTDNQVAVEAMQRGVDRLLQVSEQLLELHRSGAAAGSADGTETVDLVPLVAEVGAWHEEPARRQGLSLELDTPAHPVLVVGSAPELQNVVANLVGNALKYTPEGGRVEVCLEQRGEMAVLTCTDTGIGIAAEEQAHVFDEFFRSADPAASAQTGTGLGLAIVRRIVERHGGRIHLDSEAGRGSAFRVTLPLA